MRLASARMRARSPRPRRCARSLPSSSVAPSFSCVPSRRRADPPVSPKAFKTGLQSGGTLRILTGGSFRLPRIPAERSESNAFFTHCCSSRRARRRPRLGPARTSEVPVHEPFGVPVRHSGGPAHGGPGHHHRQRRPAPHSRGPRPLRGRALLGHQRLPAHLRRAAPPRGPLRRSPRTAPDLPARHRHLHRELALRWLGGRRLDAPVRPCPAGRRRRTGRALLTGAAHHHLLGRAPAGPGHRPLHDRVGGRGSDRPRGGRRARPSWSRGAG